MSTSLISVQDVQLWARSLIPWGCVIVSLASVVVASYLGRRFALAGARLEINEARAAVQRERIELRRRLTAALLGEIEGVESRIYNQRMAAGYRQLAKQFEGDGGPTNWQPFVAHQSYTVVYDSLAEKLGCFDAESAREIARFYTELKGLIDVGNNIAEKDWSIIAQGQAALAALFLADATEKLVYESEKLKARLLTLHPFDKPIDVVTQAKISTRPAAA